MTGDMALAVCPAVPPPVPSLSPSSVPLPCLPRELQDLQDGVRLRQSHQVLSLPLQLAVLCKYATPRTPASLAVAATVPKRIRDSGMESPLPAGSLTKQKFLPKALCLGWGWTLLLCLSKAGWQKTAPQCVCFVLLLTTPSARCLLQFSLNWPSTPHLELSEATGDILHPQPLANSLSLPSPRPAQM